MTRAKVLIVNADDFGLSPGVDRGILEAHDNGIVTSTSLMVRGRDATEAVRAAALRPLLSVGLHLDFGEYVYRDDEWVEVYKVVDTNDETAVASEVAAQLQLFRDLTGRNPTHIDSHQHRHTSRTAAAVVLDISNKLGVPVRDLSDVISYTGKFYGQTKKGFPYASGVSVEHLISVIADLPMGVTELGCHPGYADDTDDTYKTERELEVAALCHPDVRSALRLHEVTLSNFAAFAMPANTNVPPQT